MPRTSAPACRPGDPRWEAAARIVVETEADIFRVVPKLVGISHQHTVLYSFTAGAAMCQESTAEPRHATRTHIV